jgi:hypothetical protein
MCSGRINTVPFHMQHSRSSYYHCHNKCFPQLKNQSICVLKLFHSPYFDYVHLTIIDYIGVTDEADTGVASITISDEGIVYYILSKTESIRYLLVTWNHSFEFLLYNNHQSLDVKHQSINQSINQSIGKSRMIPWSPSIGYWVTESVEVVTSVATMCYDYASYTCVE